MKHLNPFYLFIFSALLLSCSNNDDQTPRTERENPSGMFYDWNPTVVCP